MLKFKENAMSKITQKFKALWCNGSCGHDCDVYNLEYSCPQCGTKYYWNYVRANENDFFDLTYNCSKCNINLKLKDISSDLNNLPRYGEEYTENVIGTFKKID
jgi:transcription initiation factor IIE alpha subunit